MIDPRTKDVCLVARMLTSGLRGQEFVAHARRLNAEGEAHRKAWLASRRQPMPQSILTGGKP